jgi:hypothetical protein
MGRVILSHTRNYLHNAARHNVYLVGGISTGEDYYDRGGLWHYSLPYGSFFPSFVSANALRVLRVCSIQCPPVAKRCEMWPMNQIS